MSSLAIQLCQNRKIAFEDAFRFQYVIDQTDLGLPGFRTHRVSNFYLQHGPGLWSTIIKDRQERELGVLIGVAADHDGQNPEDALAKILDADDPQSWEIFESYLVNLSGRYGILLHMNGETRYYVDPVGMIGSLYSIENNRIASSLYLALDRQIRLNPLFDHDAVSEGEGGYGLYHTQDEFVLRMNANYYMRLEDFTDVRFWPRKDDRFEAPESEYGAIYDEMIVATRNVIENLSARYPTSMPLSGGNDSRILFALAGDKARKQIKQFYTHIHNYAGKRDASIAAMLTARKKLHYEIHSHQYIKYRQFVRATNNRKWSIASGTNVPAPREVRNGIGLSVLENSVVMRGHQTNIMRGQYFFSKAPEKTQHPLWQLRMLSLASKDDHANQVFVAQLRDYYEELPKNAKPVRPDFVFYEILVPAALGVLFQGVQHAFYMSPFNSRRLVQLSMQFSLEHKMQNHATHDLILRADADLSGLPFHYDFGAPLSAVDEMEREREQRIELTLARYKEIFGEDAPEVEFVPYDARAFNDIYENLEVVYDKS